MKKYIILLAIGSISLAFLKSDCNNETNQTVITPNNTCEDFPEVAGEDAFLNGYVEQGNHHNFFIESKRIQAYGGRGRSYNWTTPFGIRLPAGLYVHPSGVFFWTTSSDDSLVPGVYQFRMIVGDGETGTRDVDTVLCTFTVEETASLQCPLFQQPSYDIPLPQASENACYETALEFTAGCTGPPNRPLDSLYMPFTWTVTEGSLPGGITLNPSDGTLYGKPNVGSRGTYHFRVSIKNHINQAAVCQALCPEYTLHVSF
jgi:putative Ig domain-containing protein